MGHLKKIRSSLKLRAKYFMIFVTLGYRHQDLQSSQIKSLILQNHKGNLEINTYANSSLFNLKTIKTPKLPK